MQICVFAELSAMIGGAESKNVMIRNYKVEEIEGILKDFFSQT